MRSRDAYRARMIPKTSTTQWPFWLRSRHRSLMTHRFSGMQASGNKSSFWRGGMPAKNTRPSKSPTGLGPHSTACGDAEKRENLRKAKALCEEFWTRLHEACKSNRRCSRAPILHPGICPRRNLWPSPAKNLKTEQPLWLMLGELCCQAQPDRPQTRRSQAAR